MSKINNILFVATFSFSISYVFLAKTGENMFAFFTLNRKKPARLKQLSHTSM